MHRGVDVRRRALVISPAVISKPRFCKNAAAVVGSHTRGILASVALESFLGALPLAHNASSPLTASTEKDAHHRTTVVGEHFLGGRHIGTLVDEYPAIPGGGEFPRPSDGGTLQE